MKDPMMMHIPFSAGYSSSIEIISYSPFSTSCLASSSSLTSLASSSFHWLASIEEPSILEVQHSNYC
jgi:hypothetical protein